MREYIRGRLEKAVDNYDTDSKSRSLMDFIQANVRSRRALLIDTACIKGSPYSITVRRVPTLIPVLCSQPPGDVSHKPGGRLPLLSARPAVTLATLKRAAISFAVW